MRAINSLPLVAYRLAAEIGADSILLFPSSEDDLNSLSRASFSPSLVERAVGRFMKKIRLVVVAFGDEFRGWLERHPSLSVIKPTVKMPTAKGQIDQAIYLGLKEGILLPGELLVCLLRGGSDSLFIRRVKGSESTPAEVVESDRVVAATTNVAVELGKRSYRGYPVGTAFMVGDSRTVMSRSHQLFPNPFKGHGQMLITDRQNMELIRRYALLDGVFVIDEDGKILAAGRFLSAKAEVDIPKGLGTRNRAVAAMTAVSRAVGITVSEEDGQVRVYKGGKILLKIDPRDGAVEEIY